MHTTSTYQTAVVGCYHHWECNCHRAFHNEKDQHHKLQLQSLQDRITQLETTSQSCLKDKSQLLDRLSVERGATIANNVVTMVTCIVELSEKLDCELREMKMSCELLKEQNGDLQRKMSFFIKVGIRR